MHRPGIHHKFKKYTNKLIIIAIVNFVGKTLCRGQLVLLFTSRISPFYTLQIAHIQSTLRIGI